MSRSSLGNVTVPPPHLSVDQPEAFLSLRVDREHRMDEQPHVAAVADRAEPPLAPALGLIIDLARILNGEHVPARRGRRRQLRPMRYHLLDRYRLVLQKAPQRTGDVPVIPIYRITVNLKFMTSQGCSQLKHRRTEYTLDALLSFLDS